MQNLPRIAGAIGDPRLRERHLHLHRARLESRGEATRGRKFGATGGVAARAIQNVGEEQCIADLVHTRLDAVMNPARDRYVALCSGQITQRQVDLGLVAQVGASLLIEFEVVVDRLGIGIQVERAS